MAIIVNNVKMIRHNRSTTIAANFQSFVISPFSSSLRSCAHAGNGEKHLMKVRVGRKVVVVILDR